MPCLLFISNSTHFLSQDLLSNIVSKFLYMLRNIACTGCSGIIHIYIHILHVYSTLPYQPQDIHVDIYIYIYAYLTICFQYLWKTYCKITVILSNFIYGIIVPFSWKLASSAIFKCINTNSCYSFSIFLVSANEGGWGYVWLINTYTTLYKCFYKCHNCKAIRESVMCLWENACDDNIID